MTPRDVFTLAPGGKCNHATNAKLAADRANLFEATRQCDMARFAWSLA